ncbi:MAG: oligosaccharide flippase family protein [Sedimentisphaerales bacterium]|nr:oligosaccharide flippase family protein [Sedimentisphaerales bacterium]
MIKQQNKQVILNMVSNLGAALATMLFFFLLSPYFRSKLGDSAYGAWAFLGSLLAYFSLINPGLSAGLIKYFSEFNALNAREKNVKLINTCFFLYLILTGIAIILSVILYNTVEHFPKLRDADPSIQIRLVLLIVALTFSLNLPFTVFQNALRGLQRYDICNLLVLCKTFVTGTANVLAIHWGYGLVGFVLSTAIVSIGFNLLSVIVAYRLFPFKLSLRLCDRQLMRKLYHFSSYAFVGAVANVLINFTDNIVITFFLGLKYVTMFALGYRLLDSIRLCIRQLLQVLMPVASEFSVLPEPQRREKIHELFVRGSRFSAIIYLPPLLFLIVFGHEFIRAWQGASYAYARETYYIYLIHAIPATFVISQWIGGTILIGLANLRIPTLIYICNAIVNLILSLVLVQYWGIYGVALGTAIPIVFARIFMNCYYKRAFQISLLHYFKQVWRRLAPLAVFYLGALFIQRYIFQPDNLCSLLLLALINGGVFWLVSYYTLDQYERFVLRTMFNKLKRVVVLSE